MGVSNEKMCNATMNIICEKVFKDTPTIITEVSSTWSPFPRLSYASTS